jgi:hypothetical protein
MEGYSLGGESSTEASRVIAIGIPDDSKPNEPTTLISNHPIATSLSSSSSSHHRREYLMHQADDEVDDALGKLPWRRNSSRHHMSCLIASDGDELDDEFEEDDDDEWMKQDEQLARDLAAQELQQHAPNKKVTTTTTTMMMTTPNFQKIHTTNTQEPMAMMTVTNIDDRLSTSSTSSQRWWKWSPSPRSLWRKTTSVKTTASRLSLSTSTTTTTQTATNRSSHPQPQPTTSQTNKSVMMKKEPPTNTSSSSTFHHLAVVVEQDHDVPLETNRTNTTSSSASSSPSMLYPNVMDMMLMMNEDMLVDLDSCPSGDGTNTLMTTTNRNVKKNHHPKTTGLEDHDATTTGLDQPPPPPTCAAFRKSSSSSSSSSLPWSFARWQQKMQVVLPPERLKAIPNNSKNGPQLASAMALTPPPPSSKKNQGPQLASARNAAPVVVGDAATMTRHHNSTTTTTRTGPPPPTQTSEKEGPRLATPFCVSKVHGPGCHISYHPSNTTTSNILLLDTDKKKEGPQMAAAVVVERRPSLFSPIITTRRRGSLMTPHHHNSRPQLAVVSLEGGREEEEKREDDNVDTPYHDDEDDLEAQAGIPILLPGAFAVDGIDTLTRRRSRNDPEDDQHGASTGEDDDDGDDDEMEDDNLLEDVSEERRLARERHEHQALGATNDVPLVILDTPIPAELHPDEVDDDLLGQDDVQVLHVQAVNEEQEQALQSKQKQRIRTMKWVLIGLAMVAMIVVIIVVVVVRSDHSSSSNSEPINTGPAGWSMVGSVDSLIGPDDDDDEYFGWSIATNTNATSIIIGSPGWDQAQPYPPQLGLAQVFQETSQQHQQNLNSSSSSSLSQGGGNATTWSLAGSTSTWTGAASYERLGRAVAMSGNGRLVAVAAEYYISIYSLEMNATLSSPTWDLVAEFWSNSSAILPTYGTQQTTMAMTADGSCLVVGVPNAGDSNQGLVRTYAQFGFAPWAQIGQDIVGTVTDALVGTSVDISNGLSGNGGDGGGASTLESGGATAQMYRIAVGASGFDQNIGQVQTFVLQSNAWTLEQTFTASSNSNNNNNNAVAIGQAVALSQDGAHLAIGATGASTSAGTSTGQVQVYQLLSTSSTTAGGNWVPLGNALAGSSSFEQFGFSVALSSSGSVVAVGAPQAQDPVTSNSVGQVQVFQSNSGSSSTINSISEAAAVTWSQVGGTILGLHLAEEFGYTVALSADGTRVVCGAPLAPYDGGVRSNTGAVRVYETTLV